MTKNYDTITVDGVEVPYKTDEDITWLIDERCQDPDKCWGIDMANRQEVAFKDKNGLLLAEYYAYPVSKVEKKPCEFCSIFRVELGFFQIDVFGQSTDTVWSWWPVDSPAKVFAGLAKIDDDEDLWEKLYDEYRLGLR